MKRRIAKNYAYNVVYQVLYIIVPLLTTPYITRIFAPSQLGIFSTSWALFSVLMLFSQFGVSVYGTREIALLQDDSQKEFNRLRVIFSTQLASGFIFLVPCLAACYALFSGTARTVYMINACLVLYGAVEISWYFNGQEEFAVTITRNIFVKCLSLLLIFLLIKTENDLWLYAVINVGAAFIGSLFLFVSVRRSVGTVRIFSFKWIDLSVIKKAAPYMLPLVVAQLNNDVGRFILNLLKGDARAGIFDQTLKIIRMVSLFSAALVGVVGPRMAKLLSKKDGREAENYFLMSFTVLSFQAILLTCGLFVASDSFTAFFFGKEFSEVALSLKVIAPYAFTFVISESAMVLLLRQLGRTRAMLADSLIALGINGLLCLVLIPLIDLYGACAAMIISTLAVGALEWYQARRYIPAKKVLKLLSVLLFAAAVTVSGGLILKSVLTLSPVPEFLLLGASCVFMYCAVSLTLSRSLRSLLLMGIRGLMPHKRGLS